MVQLLKTVCSRAIWCAIPSDELHMCTHLTKPDAHPGYMRLGRSNAPDPSHIVSIVLPDNVNNPGTWIDNLSWDEESGRICLLVSSIEAVPKTLVIIDLL
jgi:hypothetical protein